MNLSLTNECNRRCDYCFQKSWYLAEKKEDIKEMSLETVEKVFDWMDDINHTSILGGEPLLYSKIHEFFELAIQKKKTINVISNISCNYDLLKDILEKYTKNPIVHWLINTDYPKSQKNLFIKNFELFYENNDFTLSTTLLPDKNKIMESADRINELLDMLYDRSGVEIRISPMAPNHLTNYKFYDYSLDIIEFISRVWDKGLCKIGFDCTVNGCEVNPLLSNTFKNYNNHITFKNNPCNTSGAFDILVDNSLIYCSSCNFIKLDNFMDYKNIHKAKEAMHEEWKKYWLNTTLLCNYKNCDNFNPATCLGVCAAKNEVIRKYTI